MPSAITDFLFSAQTYLVSTAIALTAVLCSIAVQQARQRRQERGAFGRLVEGVLVESANNQAVLKNISETAGVGKIINADLRVDSLNAALLSPSTVTFAPYSLVKAMSITMTWLGQFNNIVTTQRTAGSFGRGLTQSGVDDLKIRSASCRRLIIEVLQPEIEALPERLRKHMVLDKRSQNVDERLKAVLQDERQQLNKLRGKPNQHGSGPNPEELQDHGTESTCNETASES